MKKPIHILIAPSWYPTKRTPYAGIFIQEQVKALCTHTPDLNISVWNFQSELPHLSVKRPLEFLRTLARWKSQDKSQTIVHSNGLIEYKTPFLFPPRPITGLRPKLHKQLSSILSKHTQITGHSFDLIHAHVANPAGWASLNAATKSRVPWILTEHMGTPMLNDLLHNNKLPHSLLRIYNECNLLISVSNSHAKLLKTLTSREATVIPNLVDETRFAPGTPTSELSNKPAFLAIAALVPNKNIHILIKAYASAKSVFPLDFPELRIIGDGPERKRLMTLATELNVSQHIHFLGSLAHENVLLEILKCAAFVLPSQSESFGVALIEALCSGRPAIATACGGPADIMTCETGITIPAGDSNALSQALITMSKTWQEYVPQKLHETTLNRFGSRVVAKQLQDVYVDMIGNYTD